MSVTRLAISDAPPSHERARDWVEVPSAWLDALVIAMSVAPIEQGPEPVLSAVLTRLAPLLPGFALGASLVLDGGKRAYVRLGCASEARDASVDEGSIFAGLAHELLLPLDAHGSCLHLAYDEAQTLDERRAEVRFVERIALALSAALRQSSALLRAREQSEELRALQAQVVQAEKLASLGQIAAGVVHELNNPLSSIVAYSDYLQRKASLLGLEPDDVERLRRIHEAAERLRRFSRDLVTYARPSKSIASVVNVRDVLEQSLVFCEHVLDEAHTRVETSLPFEPAMIKGVSGELTQVFINLVTNACHAMPLEGGVLRVSTHVTEQTVEIAFADNGHGVDAEHLAKIFEPFFTTKIEGSGTGLGLSIVRSIIERHGGSVLADSAPGNGTCITVRLPCYREA